MFTGWLESIYFLNVIFNMMSTTGTLLFLLYRFTSFFSYVFGFLKFIKKLLMGCLYIKHSISKSVITTQYKYNNYLYNDDENNNTEYSRPNDIESQQPHSFEPNDTFFTKCTKKLYGFISYLNPKKKEYSVLPVYETQITTLYNQHDIENNTQYTTPFNHDISPEKIQQNIFNQHIQNLIDNESESDDENSIADSIPLLGIHTNKSYLKHSDPDNLYYFPLHNSHLNTNDIIDTSITDSNNFSSHFGQSSQSKFNSLIQQQQLFIDENDLFNTSKYIIKQNKVKDYINENINDTVNDNMNKNVNDDFIEQFKSLNLE